MNRGEPVTVSVVALLLVISTYEDTSFKSQSAETKSDLMYTTYVQPRHRGSQMIHIFTVENIL